MTATDAPTGLRAVFHIADEPERNARLRELRLAALLLLGPRHPATTALVDAVRNPDAIAAVLAVLDELPALQRRRLLSVLAAVL